MVVFWNLPTNSPLLRIRLSDGSLKLYPFQCFLAHDQAVRTLQWCKANRYGVGDLWQKRESGDRLALSDRFTLGLSPYFQSFPSLCGEWPENQILGPSATLWANKLYQALLEYRTSLAAALQRCHCGSRQLLCLVRQDGGVLGTGPGVGCKCARLVGRGAWAGSLRQREFWKELGRQNTS